MHVPSKFYVRSLLKKLAYYLERLDRLKSKFDLNLRIKKYYYFFNKYYDFLWYLLSICALYVQIFSILIFLVKFDKEISDAFFDGDFNFYFTEFISYLRLFVKLSLFLFYKDDFFFKFDSKLKKKSKNGLWKKSLYSKKWIKMISKLLLSFFNMNLTAMSFFRFHHCLVDKSCCFFYFFYSFFKGIKSPIVFPFLKFNFRCSLDLKLAILRFFFFYGILLIENSLVWDSSRIRSLTLWKEKIVALTRFQLRLNDGEVFAIIVLVWITHFLFGFCFILGVRKGKVNKVRETNWKLWLCVNYLINYVFLTVAILRLCFNLPDRDFFARYRWGEEQDRILEMHATEILFY